MVVIGDTTWICNESSASREVGFWLIQEQSMLIKLYLGHEIILCFQVTL